jgi:hypothetical protein
MENKTGKYFKYAIGEIILVVIGILIALQLNSLQQDKTNDKTEIRYVSNLISELERDSTGLKNTYQIAIQKIRSKVILLDLIDNERQEDSLTFHFNETIFPFYEYTPLKSTYTEMISNGNLGIIKPNVQRKNIIEFYSSMDEFITTEKLLFSQGTQLVEEMRKRVPSFLEPKKEDILSLKNDFYAINKLESNGAITRAASYKDMLEKTSTILAELKSYQKEILK